MARTQLCDDASCVLAVGMCTFPGKVDGAGITTHPIE